MVVSVLVVKVIWWIFSGRLKKVVIIGVSFSSMVSERLLVMVVMLCFS